MSELHPLSGLNLDHAGLEILDVDECQRLLAITPVARIAFVDHGEPVIMPITYGMWGRSIVFATDPGSKLDAAIMERPVAVEIDGWDAEAQIGWSVLVKGSASTVDDEADVERLDRESVATWIRGDTPMRWVRVLPNEVTGRRIVPH